MTLIMKKGQSEQAPDLKAFAASLTPAQIAFLAHVLLYAAEGDYSVYVELYVHVSNIYNDMPPDYRKEAGNEGADRFFSAEALERYKEEEKGEELARSRIITP